MTSKTRARDERRRRLAIAAYALATLGVTAIVLAHSLAWVGRIYPGFLLMDNRVVPSVGLGHWSGLESGPIYQHQVVAIDGERAPNARAVYRHVATQPPDTPFRYLLSVGSHNEERTIRSMRFAMSDYLSLFGALLMNGLIFTAVGIAVWVLGPRAAPTTGTVVLALNTGAFCLTAMDLYGPAIFFRLHVTTEALFPATLLHLTLVFPVVRLPRHRRAVLTVLYLADVVLVALYQRYLYEPVTYSTIHNVCMAASGLAGAALIGAGIHAYFTSTSLLVRKRLGIVLLGTVTGFALPAWILTTSGLSGGDRALNLAAFTAFLFPLSLAYAVVKLDLFEIDAMLRRGINYLLLTGAVIVIYALSVLALGFVLQTASLTQTPAFPVIFSLVMIALFTPMRDRIQQAVDRLYYRTSHNAQKTLERASGELVGTLNLDEICALTIETISGALMIENASLWLRNKDEQFAPTRRQGRPWPFSTRLAPDHPLVDRLRRSNRAVSAYDFADDLPTGPADRTCQETLHRLRAELVLPLAVRGELTGLIVLGEKRSRTLFTLDDLDFLHTFANHVAVAILNARSYRKIEELNVGLEHEVARRTSELAATNEELAQSLSELTRAYNDLQRSQDNLLRAEKMAALGKLTAGIAHEVNTPLGASLNSLKVVDALVEEYASSIGDPQVTEDDHHELAGELRELVGHVSKWMNKAAGYIRSIKAHTRSLEGVDERTFEVAQLIEDTRLLLAHRLRLSSCSITVDCHPGVTVFGDPGKLGQVLTNLITNAIDAYDDAPAVESTIRIHAVSRPDHVAIAVEDDGCGIERSHMERIFEALFTTKSLGKGTGLGLAIARDIMSDCFGGRIEVDSTPGVGSRFTLWIPRREPRAVDHRCERTVSVA